MVVRKEFLLQCRRNGIFPAHIQNSFRCLFHLFEERSPYLPKLERCVDHFKKTILNLEIKQTFHKLNLLHTEKLRLENGLQQSVSSEIWNSFSSAQTVFAQRNMDNVRRTTNSKFQRLLTKSLDGCRKQLTSANTKALSNATNITIPKNVELLLSLGPKFTLPETNISNAPFYHVIADVESIIKTNENKDVQERNRCKVANNIQNYLHRNRNAGAHHTPSEKFYRQAEIETRTFIKQHPEICILKADKGNKTIIMNRDDYNARMDQLLNDRNTYDKVQRDPTSRFQSKNNEIVRRLEDLGLLDYRTASKLRIYKAVCPKKYTGSPRRINRVSHSDQWYHV